MLKDIIALWAQLPPAGALAVRAALPDTLPKYKRGLPSGFSVSYSPMSPSVRISQAVSVFNEMTSFVQ